VTDLKSYYVQRKMLQRLMSKAVFPLFVKKCYHVLNLLLVSSCLPEYQVHWTVQSVTLLLTEQFIQTTVNLIWEALSHTAITAHMLVRDI